MDFIRLRLGVFITNTYIIKDEASGTALLIDPADNHKKIEDFLGGCVPKLILLTHGHSDHIYESPYFREKYGAEVCLHEKDIPCLADDSFSNPSGAPFEKRTYICDRTFNGGETLDFGKYRFSVIKTPGHTEGSVCYYCESEKTLFSGDTLFYRSIGRTDFPLGDPDMMKSSLAELMKLPVNTLVEPGHGFETSIGAERTENPFIRALGI